MLVDYRKILRFARQEIFAPWPVHELSVGLLRIIFRLVGLLACFIVPNHFVEESFPVVGRFRLLDI